MLFCDRNIANLLLYDAKFSDQFLWF